MRNGPKASLAYGKGRLEFNLPSNARIDVVEPLYTRGLADQTGAVRRSLEDPIDSPPLSRLIRDGQRIAVVFSDISRATPYSVILPPLLEVLEKKKTEIIFFNATGTHRANTEEELKSILGPEVVKKYSILQNDAAYRSSHRYAGTTSRSNRVYLHEDFLSCELKILTGFIEPHFFAGFSGGGKAVMPGMAGLETVQYNHGAKNIDHPDSRWGITEGNPIWEDVHEAAEMVEGLFLLNVTMNRDRVVTGVFSGKLREAHAEGVRRAREEAMVEVPFLYDIVVTGNSGYPLDLNLYQAVKGMSAAYQIVKAGGDIIVAADCWDGIPAHGSYGKLLAEAESPAELLEMIRHSRTPVQDMWQAQIHAIICERNNIHFFSENLTDRQIRDAFMNPVIDIGDRIREIMEKASDLGDEFRICVLPQGPLTIPYCKNQDFS